MNCVLAGPRVLSEGREEIIFEVTHKFLIPRTLRSDWMRFHGSLQLRVLWHVALKDLSKINI